MEEIAPSPIVVFGAPRSGTTYLNAILNAHPDVFITHETRIFVWAERTRTELLERPQVFRSHRDAFQEYLDTQLPTLIQGFYRHLRPQARYWGDKNPHYASPSNIASMDLVHEWFPTARFIHIMRDGRDVVASLLRKSTPDGTEWASFEQAHEVWTGHISTAADWIAGHPGVGYELRYEDLIADDVEVAAAVFEFLGLDMPESVRTFCLEQREERTPMSGPTRDLADVARSEWADVLDGEEQKLSLELFGDHLTRFGYA